MRNSLRKMYPDHQERVYTQHTLYSSPFLFQISVDSFSHPNFFPIPGNVEDNESRIYEEVVMNERPGHHQQAQQMMAQLNGGGGGGEQPLKSEIHLD